MFFIVEQVMPDAVQEVVPVVNVAPVGDTRTIWYAIGQKSSGNAGNGGAAMNAPTVVVTPAAVATIWPCTSLITPARLVPQTRQAQLLLVIAGNATPVTASVVGDAVLVCAASVVPNFPLMENAVVTVVV